MREPRVQHPCRKREKHYVMLWMLIQVQGLIKTNRYDNCWVTEMKCRKSEKKKCYSTIKYIGFTAYCTLTTIKNAVRGQIATILVSEDIQNVQRAHSNVDWTRNIYQPMALITAIIGKDTLTYGEMKRQPDKPQFIMAM